MLNTDLVPAADGSQDRLLVLLHGLGDSMEGWRFFPQEVQLPWLNTLLVEAPDPYYGGYSWYDFFGDQAQGINRSRPALHQLLDSLPARGFRHDRIVLMGFSQGCVMTLDAGLRYPKRLAGLVGLSGYVFDIDRLLPELPPIAREQRVLVTHGTRDPLLPIDISRDHAQKLKAAGLDVTWQEFNKEHTLDVIREVAVLRDFITRALTPAP